MPLVLVDQRRGPERMAPHPSPLVLECSSSPRPGPLGPGSLNASPHCVPWRDGAQRTHAHWAWSPRTSACGC
eukprot:12141512-Heterocapsa_arctica.AAC.1